MTKRTCYVCDWCEEQTDIFEDEDRPEGWIHLLSGDEDPKDFCCTTCMERWLD